MAEKKLAKNGATAWLNADHPWASGHGGAGVYEVLEDNVHEVNEVEGGGREIIFTNTNVTFGKKLVWRKDTPDPEDEPGNPANNKGYYVYEDSVGSED